MATEDPDVPPVHDPEETLERALIQEFLHMLGFDLATVDALPELQRRYLLQNASIYAAGKLAEIESRGRFLAKVQGKG
jgi:hypothetical protein